MRIGINKIFKKLSDDYRLQVIVIFGVVFVINTIISFFMKYPIINDEFCILSDIAELSNVYDWTTAYTSSTTGYWGYGFGIFLIPLLYITDSMAVVYHVGLIFNSILVAFVAIICYQLSCKYIKQRKPVSVLCSLCVAFFPGLTFYSKMFLNEIMLVFLAWSSIYLIIVLQNEKLTTLRRLLCEILLGGMAFFAYSVHGRGLVITIVSLLTVFVLRIFSSKIRIIPVMVGAAAIASADQVIKNRLYSSLIVTQPEETYNSLSKVIGDHLQFLKFENIKGFISALASQSYYLTCVTLGLFFIFIGCIIAIVVSYKKGWLKERLNYTIIALYSLFSVLGTLILSSFYFVFVFTEHETKAREYIIYGRYIDTIVTLALFCVLHFFFLKIERKIKCWAIISGSIINCIILLLGATKIANWLVEYSSQALSYVMVEGIIPIGGNEFLNLSTRESCIRLVLIVFCLFVFLLVLLAKKNKYVFLFIMIFSLYSSLYSLKNYLLPASQTSYESTEDAMNFLSEYADYANIIYVEEYAGRTLNLQSKLPNTEICMLDTGSHGYEEYENIQENSILISNYEQKYSYYLEGCRQVQNTDNLFVWVYGEELQQELEDVGVTFIEPDAEIDLNLDMFYSSSGDSVYNDQIWLLPGEEMYGPYIPLESGIYDIEISGENLTEAELKCIDNGGKTIFEIKNVVNTGEKLSFELSLPVNAVQLEIIVKNTATEENLIIDNVNIHRSNQTFEGDFSTLVDSKMDINWYALNKIDNYVYLGENTYQGQTLGKIFENGYLTLNHIICIPGEYELSLTGSGMDGLEFEIFNDSEEIYPTIEHSASDEITLRFTLEELTTDLSIKIMSNEKYDEVINSNISITYLNSMD